MCTILPPEFFSFGTAGVPAPSVEIKLRDIPETGYFANASPPQGEVLMRGPSVTAGYYKRPDLNSDPSIFTADGWFRTGDVGMWNPDGTLSIIDRFVFLSFLRPNLANNDHRIKNLIKLEGGEVREWHVCRPRSAMLTPLFPGTSTSPSNNWK
jgi:long-chain acyl-CoA synthetase